MRRRKQGCLPTIDEQATLSPSRTRHIKRIGISEFDLSAVLTLNADDLTFVLEPPSSPQVIEAAQKTQPVEQQEKKW